MYDDIMVAKARLQGVFLFINLKGENKKGVIFHDHDDTQCFKNRFFSRTGMVVGFWFNRFNWFDCRVSWFLYFSCFFILFSYV